MKKRTKITLAALIAAALALSAGIAGMAVADSVYGSRSDPLVTKSYLDSVLTPAIMEEVERLAAQKTDELMRDLDSRLAESAGPAVTGEAAEWEKLTLKSGETLVCAYGTEIILRLGAAKTAGPDAPRLIDETDGVPVADAGASIAKNHLYFVSIVNNGITASADNTVVFVKGSYTVS